MNNKESLIDQVEHDAAEQNIDPRLLIDCLDLTQLGDDDTEETIAALCVKALTYQVAAVCVYPSFVSQAKAYLSISNIPIATVINFPLGGESLPTVLAAIEHSLKQGADEFDVVIPYQAYLENPDAQGIKNFVSACKALLPNQCLKIILESGAPYTSQLLEAAALASLEGGANFLKTSTGKIARGANLQDAALLIASIQKFGDRSRGFKASGGVRSALQAKQYYVLAKQLMGADWPNKNTFRLGASSLLDDLGKMTLGNKHE